MIATILHYLAHNRTELAGGITTCVGIWLTARRSLLCWPIILAADFLYLIVFYRAGLLSDAILQIFFVFFTVYGWWNWWRGVQQEGEVRVVPMAAWKSIVAISAGIIGTFAIGALTKRMHAALPYPDASLLSFSLVASWWQAQKHIANWWLWIIVDLCYIGEYIYKDLWLTAVIYAVLVWIAVEGLRDWRRAPQEAAT
jgi:nicotinamide mononucleotide transporter